MSKFGKINDKLSLPSIDNEESLLRLFDKDNPDKTLFNLVDEENVRLAGSPLMIYKYYQTESQVDSVYLEERNKAIAYEPVLVYGHYDPRPIEQGLTQFGIELSNDQLFTFNKSYVERRLGRVLIPGDIIKPVFQEIKFEIFEVQESSFEAYGIYHLSCYGKVLRDTEDTHRQVVEEAPQQGTSIQLRDPYDDMEI